MFSNFILSYWALGYQPPLKNTTPLFLAKPPPKLFLSLNISDFRFIFM